MFHRWNRVNKIWWIWIWTLDAQCCLTDHWLGSGAGLPWLVYGLMEVSFLPPRAVANREPGQGWVLPSGLFSTSLLRLSGWPRPGSVVVERPPGMREVGGSIPGRVKQKTLKFAVLLLCLALSTKELDTVWPARSQNNGLGWDITAYLWVVFQWASTIKTGRRSGLVQDRSSTYTPTTCSRWYDHECLKADYKPDSSIHPSIRAKQQPGTSGPLPVQNVHRF